MNNKKGTTNTNAKFILPAILIFTLLLFYFLMIYSDIKTKEVLGVSNYTIENVNEVVIANKTVNIRILPVAASKKVGTLKKDTEITRIGILSNGWSLVLFNGKECYIKSQYIQNKASETIQVEVIMTVEETLAKEAFNLINKIRIDNGLPELKWDTTLQDCAKIRSAEASIYWSHTRPDGTSWDTVNSLVRGENLGKNYFTAQEIVNAWMASEGHKANILESRYTTIGMACIYVGEEIYWSQSFGCN